MNDSTETMMVAAGSLPFMVTANLAAPPPATAHDLARGPGDGVVPHDLGLLWRQMVLAGCETDGDTAVQRLADGLRTAVGCPYLLLGLRLRGDSRIRVHAFSGAGRIEMSPPITRLFADNLDEATQRETLQELNLSWSAPQLATTPQSELARHLNCEQMLSGPLRDPSGRIVGAWVALRASTENSPGLADRVRSLQGTAGVGLSLIYRAQRTLRDRVREVAIKACRGRRLLIAGTACMLTISGLLVPVPYRIRCDARLQPATLRYVTAPYESLLDATFVEPGDVVKQGQLLARLDGREIQWQLSGHRAELNRARKQHDASLATRDTAAAQLAHLEMDRLQGQIELLESRVAHLEIKCPLDGLVIGGDAKKAVGAKLSIGQTLFEVGALENMIMEVEVPDSEISRVQPGQSVNLRLEAYPHQVFHATIKTIHPRIESRDHAGVFIAEAHIAQEDDALRPGMRGRAHIDSSLRSLGWQLFHRPWEQALFLFGW